MKFEQPPMSSPEEMANIEKDKNENQENKEGYKISFPENINIVKALQKS